MRTFKLFLILVLFTEMTYAQSSDDLVIAKRIKINSAVLGEERTIYVSTPSNYNDSKDTYPVLYVLTGEPEVIGLVKYLSESDLMCPQMIIVSIGVNPTKDLFPSKPKYSRGTQPSKPWYNKTEDNELKTYRPDEKIGEADKYLSFVETELFPFIEKNYRTVPYRICYGHSKGGLCVTHAFLSHTHMFNAYIALNPSLYWDDGLVMKTAEEKLKSLNLKHKMFYFDIGEYEIPSTIGDAYNFAQTIRINASANLRWKLDYLPNADHGNATAIGLINAIKFIYDGWKFDTEKIKKDGFGAIDSFYKSQSEKYGYEISYGADLLNTYGWSFLRNKKLEEAIKIFNENARRFPNSSDAYNYLGEGYLAAGNTEMAIKNYEIAVELAKKNSGNIEFLKRRLDSIKANKK